MKKTLIIIAVSMLALMAVAYAGARIPENGPFQELVDKITNLQAKNNVLEERVELIETSMECTAGNPRDCGSDIGDCELGTEICGIDNHWSGECLGGTGPINEICDGTDNDCDGIIDEDCNPPSCTDGQQNQDETDTDCGGSCPIKCDLGMGCSIDADCISGICNSGFCYEVPGP